MVLQVLDLVSPSSAPFYGDCPQTYTDLDVNATGHTTCTVIPQGTIGKIFDSWNFFEWCAPNFVGEFRMAVSMWNKLWKVRLKRHFWVKVRRAFGTRERKLALL
ncbi:hypothetical protein Zmor_019496 [Zophobas morio]|uniref:Uncharacterized protein n=1 Tax=Zophobas morio TaxID=2755281 RepID=A0AA38M8I3_9CUCU|nr:hypothetical protein Zmor_019496 [Zophobas morio]